MGNKLMMTSPINKLSPRQEKQVLIATAIVSGMGFADMMAVNTALPVIQVELNLDATEALWVAEIYLLFVASLMMMGGALGDRFGRRRVFRYGILAFAISSIFCAMSESAMSLILGRAMQGLAAALTMPSSLALLNACFPPERRGHAIGSWTAISSMMLPLGPLIGGAAVDLLSWHWIFLINLPLCIAALIILRGVPKPPFDLAESKRLDIPGIIGITSGLGAMVFGLLEGARSGFSSTIVVGALVAAAILLPLTIVFEAKTRDPMLPLWMFRRRVFMVANLQTFLFFSGFQGAMFLLPFFYIQIYGFTALQAGAAGLPISIAIILLSRPVGRFLDKRGAGPLLAIAPFIVAIGLYLLTQMPTNGTFLRNVFPAIAVISVGLGLFITPITTVALNAAGEGRSGLASAVNNTVARVAGLISVALMGVLLSAGFSRHMIEHLGHLGFTSGQIADVMGRINQLGAIIPPTGISKAQAVDFEILVNAAFSNGFANAVTAAAALMFIAGVVGYLRLRNIKNM